MHAVEVEAVERQADVLHVKFLDDRPSFTERVDGSSRMADELDRDAHAVLCGDLAHLLEALDSRLVDFLARDLLEADRRYRDDRLAADLLAPLAHLAELAQRLLVVIVRQVVEVLECVERPRLDRMRGEVLGQFIDGVHREIVLETVHRADLDHVIAVLLAECQVLFERRALAFECRCFIHAEFHVNTPLLLFIFICPHPR